MRIGIDIRTLMDKQYSGVAEYVLNLLHALFKLDQVNQYFLFYNSAHDLSQVMPSFNYPNVQIVKRRYPNKVLNYILLKFFHWPRTSRLFGQQLDYFLMPHLNFIATEKNIKNILTVHDLSFLRYPYFFSWQKNFWHYLINVKKLIKKFNQIVVISENTKQDLIELCEFPAEKIKVIYSAIDKKYLPVAKTDEQILRIKQKLNLPNKFILSLGTIEPRKNLAGLIAGYEKFREHNPEAIEIKLVIAGGQGWKNKNIYQLIKSSKYSQDIILTGYVSNQEKVALYNLAEVLVYPSFYEGFGFPPLEAMACNLPVICSFAASLPEVVGQGAILIDPYNARQISQALKMIIFDQELRNNLTAKAKIELEKFNWEKVAREYLQLLK